MAKFHKVSGVIDLTLDDIEMLAQGREICSSPDVIIRRVPPDINSKAQVLNALGLRLTSVTAGPAAEPKKPPPSPTRLSDGKPIGSPPEPTTVEKGGTPH